MPRRDRSRRATWWTIATLIGAFVGGPARADGDLDRRTLPPPARTAGASLASVLATRRSVRTFRTTALDDAALGQLVWAAQGITDGHRTAPSAGALYPLTVWVADARGVWRYLPTDHALVRTRAEDQRARLVPDQDELARAPVLIVITGQTAITARKYGKRAERYVMLEAGHAAQNLLLTATALELGAVPIGAFDDRAVRTALGVPDDTLPLYVIPVGAP